MEREDLERIATNIHFRNKITRAFPNAFHVVTLPNKDRVAILKTFLDSTYNEEDRFNLGLLDNDDFLLFSREGITFLKPQYLKAEVSPYDILSNTGITKVLEAIRERKINREWEGTTERDIIYLPYAKIHLHHIENGINFYKDFNPEFEDALYLTMSDLNERFDPSKIEETREIKVN